MSTRRGREPPRPEGGTSETPGRVQPHSLLRESVTGGELHRHRAFPKMKQLHRHSPSSQAPGLSQIAAASQPFAFFTCTGPFPKRSSFIGIHLLHMHRAFPKTQQLHRHSPSSHEPGLSQNAAASPAFAFFTGIGPFPKCSSFTGICLLHRNRAIPRR